MSDRPPVSDEDVLTVFAATDETHLRPVDVSEDLPIPPEDLRDRLDDLTERGRLVDSDRQSGTAYRLAEGALDDVDLPDDVLTDVEAQAERATGSETPPREQETPETQPSEPQEGPAGIPYEYPADRIESFDPPGTPDQADDRRTALRRAYEYLRERGTATRADLVADVYPEARGAYDDPDAGWWSEVIAPGFERLPDVERSGEEWRFTGETE